MRVWNSFVVSKTEVYGTDNLFLEFQKMVLKSLIKLEDNQKIIMQQLNAMEGGVPQDKREKVLKEQLSSMEAFDQLDASLSEDAKFQSLVSYR